MPSLSAAKLEALTSAPSLTDRFIFPPFTVLDARSGAWQARKRQWIQMGIQSELGRGDALTYDTGLHPYDGGGDSPSLRADAKALDGAEGREDGLTWNTGGDLDGYRHGGNMSGKRKRKANATPGGSPLPAANQSGRRAMDGGKTVRGDGRGRILQTLDSGEGRDDYLLYKSQNRLNEIMGQRNGGLEGGISGTSIFDPVLCELFYRWFTAPGQWILDPFAGGSVRGVVAVTLGRHYAGIDLSMRQCQANAGQAVALCPPDNHPHWYCGDSLELSPVIEPDQEFHAMFSCPPYLDLEVYSDDPHDLSNMSFEGFVEAYTEIITRAARRLAPNSFAGFVVGDVRDKNGYYRNFPALTIEAFEKAGLRYYNECILVTAVGSLPIRTSKAFVKSRKLGRTHQNLIIAVKGDPVKAAEMCGTVDTDAAAQAVRDEGLWDVQ